jgi:hypothetical protein
MKRRRNAYKISIRKPGGRSNLDDVGVDGKMILNETDSE